MDCIVCELNLNKLLKNATHILNFETLNKGMTLACRKVYNLKSDV